jgi:hypothetical protein
MVKYPRMRHFRSGDTNHVETWWSRTTEIGVGVVPVKSDNLEPVRLPVGLEVTVATMLRHLPSKREREAKRFLALTERS